ncbi:TRAP transporter small permease [Oceanobacillus halotolerans]|uniref:TRAP transporter small permease n=1 Tax=Oceanobacillus halotolerans TaxID=2663380 RepID=UPI0013D951C6|nr:TRAP transporter small permease [Oceanobacillus halotolerans]
METNVLRWIEKLISGLTVVVFALMTIIVFAQVVFRYVFDMNIHWAEEFARFGMVWIAFLGAAIGIKYEEHTRIDFFIKKLPPAGRTFIEILNKLICIVFLAVISYYSITSLGDMMSLMTPSLQIPTGIVHLIIPVTGIVMIIYLIIQMLGIIRNSNEKGDQPV